MASNDDDDTQKSLQCILHTGQPLPNEDIKNFDSEVWQKVEKASEARRTKTNFDLSKYAPICMSLPVKYNNVHGYHSSCYKNFTAISDITPKVSSTSDVLLRSEVIHPVSGNNEKFKKICIFCGRKDIRRKRQIQERLGFCENRESEINIKQSAKTLRDHEMIAKVESIDFVSKGVQYHHSCRKQYINRADRIRKKSKFPDSSYDQAFMKIKEYIEEHIIIRKRPELLTSIYERYRTILTELGCYTDNQNAFFFGRKVIQHYVGQLKMGMLSKKQGNVIYPVGMDESEAVKSAIQQAASIEVKTGEVAMHIRKMILEVRNASEDFSYPLSAETLMKGQAKPPDLLVKFFRVLFTGSDNIPEERIQRYVDSVSDDCLFACTKGWLKPSKHVCLGLGLKSLTGSRKIIDVLNRLGHCCSYHTIEGFETDLAMSVSEKNNVTPDGINKVPGLSTALAWDNYDEMTETLSGSGSLHDTVGICYQNDNTDSISSFVKKAHNSYRPTGKRRSRSFESSDNQDLEPYRKKPRISNFNYSIKTSPPPDKLKYFKRLDTIWTLLCSQYTQTPMWTGWNSRIIIDQLPKQNICYMENLTLPPTRLDVVAETMRISQKVAEECNEAYAIVHYDLAIAKPAKQIQQEESPKFDNIFICFGPFHIQLAYFGSLGYLIDESGGPEILIDSEVLASGSLNGFITGKHYNRCKRLHMLLYQAFKILHLRAFLQDMELTDGIKTVLEDLINETSAENLDQLGNLEDCDEFMNRYDEFTDKTRTGEHGKTAQYWMIYMDLVHLHLLFSRACHTNDLHLFTYCVGEMVKVFFATSRPNYARWMFRYHLDLLNMDETHPGVRQILEAGAFTIRRTSKSFSRCPVDLTLEQTINADAASRLTGISSFSTIAGARRRWMLTQSSRRSIVSCLLRKAGMTNHLDPVQELKPSRILRDNKDLQNIISGIEDKMNPFKDDCGINNLYCLSTGKILPVDVAEDLLSVNEKGKIWMKEFESGCFNDASRFETPIPRRKIKNFADSAVKMKVTCKDRTIKQLKCSRDLFGRLLFLATTMNIDLKKIFSYPLTPVPLSLSHIDGTVMKTDKSKLMKNLEERIKSEAPSTIDVTIVDGMFLIQTLTNLPTTFGEIARSILIRLTSLSKRVDFVCDTYNHPSIKDMERMSRGTVFDGISISGPAQKRPKEFQKALQSESFKTSLLMFLAREWSKDTYASVIKDCHLYFGVNDTCYLFTSDRVTVTCIEVLYLKCMHGEADTRIVWHMQDIAKHDTESSVVIRSNDTDVLVILLNHVRHYRVKVWMDAGLNGFNNRRYIDVCKLSDVLGCTLCDALPAIHAFSGCDYTAAFVRKGKIRPFLIAEKSAQYMEAFAELGTTSDVKTETETTLESYVCTLYGKPALSNVDEARYALFRTKFAPTDEKEPLGKLKGADATCLPPSRPVLHEKILRTNLVSYMWRNANKSVPLEMNPTDNGWIEEEGSFVMKWFEGPQMPLDIECVIAEIDNETNIVDEITVLDEEDDQDFDENENEM